MRTSVIVALLLATALTGLAWLDREFFHRVVGNHASTIGTALQETPKRYMNALEMRPLTTKCTTAFILFSISDLNAQLISAREHFPAYARTLRFALWGSLVGAPLLHVWYTFLGNFFTGHVNLGLWTEAFLMSSIDQTFFFPTYASFYFLYAELTTGGSHIVAYMKLRRELFPLVARASLFWVPSNTINFAFSPPSLRVPIVCALSIVWNTYFSYVTQRTSVSDVEYGKVGNTDAADDEEDGRKCEPIGETDLPQDTAVSTAAEVCDTSEMRPR